MNAKYLNDIQKGNINNIHPYKSLRFFQTVVALNMHSQATIKSIVQKFLKKYNIGIEILFEKIYIYKI